RLGGTSGQRLPRWYVRFSGRITLAVRCGRRDDRPHADDARARGQARGRCGVQGWWRVASRRCAFKAAGFVAMKRLKRKPMSRTFTAIAGLAALIALSASATTADENPTAQIQCYRHACQSSPSPAAILPPESTRWRWGAISE